MKRRNKEREHATQTIAAQRLHDARIEYLLDIGGDAARTILDAGRLNPQQIAKLCRRMPPFIIAKLHELNNGGTKIDTNPTGAFDTNGFGELRVRLPKFRATLQHHAHQLLQSPPGDLLSQEGITKLRTTAKAIVEECDRLLDRLGTFTAEGAGRPRKATKPVARSMDWRKAPTRLAQALGVLKKTNRDMASVHWRLEWKPTVMDLHLLTEDVQDTKTAALILASVSSEPASIS